MDLRLVSVVRAKVVSSGLSICRNLEGRVTLAAHEDNRHILVEISEAECARFSDDLVQFCARERRVVAGNLISKPIGEARQIKWQAGREKYGPEFSGHPLLCLYEELLDSMNYVEEAKRQGYEVFGLMETFEGLARQLQAMYRESQTIKEAV